MFSSACRRGAFSFARSVGLGPELSADVNLDSAGTWAQASGTGTWTVAGGLATGAAADGHYLFQTGRAILNGATYQIQVAITAVSAGSVQAFVGAAGSARSAALTAPGNYSMRLVANSTDQLGIVGTNFTGSVTSLSVRKVLP